LTSDHGSSDRDASHAIGRAPRLLARLLGLTVDRIGPGTAVVSRSAVRFLRLRPGVTVVAVGSRRASVQRVRINKRAWLVTQRDASPQAEPVLDKQVGKLFGERHVAWLLRAYRVDCVLDVGANRGQYGQSLRRHGYAGHIVSFEPVPQFHEALATASAEDDKWTVHHVALGSAEGTVPMRVQHSFSSVLTSSEYGKQRFEVLRNNADNDLIEVPLRRLDELLDEVLAPVIASGVVSPRIYLKLDTQGFDLEVFRGLGGRINDVVAMQSEVALLPIYENMPRMPEALATYEAAGFEVTGMYPVSREADGRVIEYDAVMVRSGEFSAD
jgi:FkbM family methyltransferase